MSSNKRTKKKGAPSRAPSRARSRSRHRSSPAQRLASPLALILVLLLALGTLGYYVQSKTPQSTPALTPQTPPVTDPPTSSNPTTSANQPATPVPKVEAPKVENLPDGRPGAWARLDRAAGATESMRQTLYWLDGRNAERLQPIEVKLPKSVETGRTAVEQLLDPPRDLKLESGIPAGTKLNGVRMTGSVMIVDLTKEVESVQGSAAANAIMATLVYSLTELPGVTAVRLMADGLPAVLHGAEWTDPLTREELQERNLFQIDNVIRFEGS